MELLPDRSAREAAAALAATWLGFVLATALALPQPPRPGLVALGALVGALLVAGGFAGTSRVRPLPPRNGPARARLALLALLAGSAVGALLLGLVVLLARAEPALRARFAGRLDETAWRPLALALESSILEEVAFRLFLLGGVAWVAARWLPRAWAVGLAVGVSTLLFGMVHLPAWAAATATTPALLVLVVALNAIAALVMAWVFWRWGLPYAILAHLAGDLVVQTGGPRLLA